MKTFMSHLLLAAALGAAISAPWAHAAPAAEVPQELGDRPAVIASVEAGTFLPLAFAPRVGADAAHAALFTTYDGAGDRALFEAAAEARLTGWLAVYAGILVESSPEQQRPLLGLRAQFLRQDAHGVDASVGLSYQLDGFREAEGRMALTLAAARHFGHLGLFTSVAYGMDPENDDRELDARAGALLKLTRHVYAGAAVRARGDLFSDDVKRKPDESDLEVSGGPVVTVALGPFAIFAQAGVSAVRVQETTAGVVAVGGLGASF